MGQPNARAVAYLCPRLRQVRAVSFVELSVDHGGRTSTYWAYYTPTYEGNRCDLGPTRAKLQWLKRRQEANYRKLPRHGPVQQFMSPMAFLMGTCSCDDSDPPGPPCGACNALNNRACS